MTDKSRTRRELSCEVRKEWVKEVTMALVQSTSWLWASCHGSLCVPTHRGGRGRGRASWAGEIGGWCRAGWAGEATGPQIRVGQGSIGVIKHRCPS